MSARRPRGRPREFDTVQAMDAVLEVFRVKGYSGTSLDDLTAATGLNRTSLYGAFGNKQALFEASVRHYWGGAGRRFWEALNATGDLRRDLQGFFRVFLDYACAKGVGGCIVACALPADLTQAPEFRERFAKVVRQSDQAVTARLAKAQEAGQLDPDADAAAIAQVLVSVMFAVSLRARGGAGRAQLQRICDTATAMVPGMAT